MDRLDTDVQRAVSFIGTTYRPRKASAGKLHSRAFLKHSFKYAKNGQQLNDIVASIEGAIGTGKTVWGIKTEDGQLSWEFYFYAPPDQRNGQQFTTVTPDHLNDAHRAIQKVVSIPDFDFADNIHMFSFDLEESGSVLLPSDVLHVYRCLQEGKTEMFLESFDFDGTGLEFRNVYISYMLAPIFRQANTATMMKLRSTIRSSPRYTADPGDIDKILIRELNPFSGYAFAHKRNHDCIYYQGLTSTQLRYFIEHTALDNALGEFIRENEELFDYLEWDAGFDYTANAQGVEIKKAGFYGYF